MWITLFVFAAGAALCFVIAAMLLQSSSQAGRAAVGRPRVRRADASPAQSPSVAASPALLSGRMRSLCLDPDQFRRGDPTVFRELSLRCSGCTEQVRCASDLAVAAADEAGETYRDWSADSWRDYCPNGAMLNALRTLRDCSSTVGADTLTPA